MNTMVYLDGCALLFVDCVALLLIDSGALLLENRLVADFTFLKKKNVQFKIISA